MQRRSFLKKSATIAGTAFIADSLNANSLTAPGKKDIYELKIYQFASSSKVNLLKKYYSEAIVPFLNKRGATVSAFSEYGMDEPPRIYILHAHKSPSDYWNAIQEMKTDRTFLDAGKSYFDLPSGQPVFERYETFLMEAFDAIPQINKPANNRGLFELRTYESHNEDAFRRKVKMFNLEELPLFEKVGLHPLFFGEILAGQYMPALTYMLWFKDMNEREANWNKFRTSQEWNTMKVKEEYADTVSKVHKKFLIPLDFSQI